MFDVSIRTSFIRILYPVTDALSVEAVQEIVNEFPVTLVDVTAVGMVGDSMSVKLLNLSSA